VVILELIHAQTPDWRERAVLFFQQKASVFFWRKRILSLIYFPGRDVFIR